MPEETFPSERALDDDYPIYYGYIYLMDGEPRRNWNLLRGTVRDLKREYGAQEIRNCDLGARGLLHLAF